MLTRAGRQGSPPQTAPSRGVSRLFTVLSLLLALPGWCAGADLEDVEELLRTGRYDGCARLAAEQLEAGAQGDRWYRLKIQAELARGKADAALISLGDGLDRYPASVALQWLGRAVYRANGRDADVKETLDTIEKLVANAPGRYDTPENRIVLGRFFLARGADSKKVLDQFYDVAVKEQPDLLDAYFATAELALAKQDYALAAETLRKAPKEAATEAQYHYLLARAYAAEDRAGFEKELDEALKINSSHVDSLLLRADHLIDSERYTDADKTLKQASAVNPGEPRLWAYRAVLAHLRNDPAGEATAHEAALKPWAANPEVDHLIGRKLSQKYRFAEGSARQRQALALDPDYLPAKVQLCEDLLRLGEETEGWLIANEVFAKDGYNVVAYNLVTLHDRLAGFRTLQADGFLLRMDPREADLYGERVLALLRRARKTLCAKYGVTVNEPVVVEIFPQKKEFAVRTFGLPGAEGFLGVCFGRVITANSPASQGEHPANWEAVLWHEFCHVVTLSKTHNKMPRWLSEGISVYEEEQQDPAWGSSLSPQYRQMLLGEDFTPLSRLSSAFLAPKSGLHIQFAYFESALAVEYLVQRFGTETLKALLDDLGTGEALNEALPKRTHLTLDQLDGEFARFARQRAESVAPEATWEEPDLPDDADSRAIETWLEKHPKSFPGLRRLGARLVAEEKWSRAKDVLEQVKRMYPEYVGAENAYVLLATVSKRLSDKAAEHAVLDDLATRDGSAGPAYLRLIELDEAAGDWEGVARNACRMLAVNPLTPIPHRALGRAAEHLNHREEALTAYRALALLDETDPADVHFRLAKMLAQSGKTGEARREVLKALEDAPRFREAHRLLLKLTEPEKPPPAGSR
ncbi:MAG: peptidase MA family metallohydrolase [Isosphaeraceae bacterium]|nr:peptidase MA family metallohydrolase [Isosphaeraceae bacterium]